MKIKLYLDEDVPLAFAQALINRGVNVVTTQQEKNKGKSDLEQLNYATKDGRTILTHNKRDFMILHNEYLRRGKEHAGIILYKVSLFPFFASSTISAVNITSNKTIASFCNFEFP